MEYLANMLVLLGLFNFLTGEDERDPYSKPLNFQSSKVISIKTIFGTSGSICVIVEPSLKPHDS